MEIAKIAQTLFPYDLSIRSSNERQSAHYDIATHLLPICLTSARFSVIFTYLAFSRCSRSFFICLASVHFSVVSKMFGADNDNKDSLKKLLKPILISAVAFITILIVLLLVASWDREERRITGEFNIH